MCDNGRHAAPVFELPRIEQATLHAVFLFFCAGQALGIIVNAEPDGRGAPDEHDGDIGRKDCGDDVRASVDPENRNPGSDDLHEVRRPASHDEHGKAEREVGPVTLDNLARVADKIDQRETDNQIAEKGDGVGNDHRPDQTRIGFPANRMRHERDRRWHLGGLEDQVRLLGLGMMIRQTASTGAKRYLV